MSDRIVEVAGFINHFWFTVLSEDDLKKQSGLKYISHAWNNDPYWYLWFDDRFGVYKMELKDARTIEGYDWQADFSIKYYPNEKESCYLGLSSLEKSYRESEIFHTHPAEGTGCPCHCLGNEGEKFTDLRHGTGAPAFKYTDMLPVDFFFAGHLFMAYKVGSGSLLRVKSQTRWRIAMTEDCTVVNHKGESLALLKKGDIDRDYAGFEICDFLFRRVVGSWALFNKYSYQQDCVWKGEGVGFLSDGKNLHPFPSSEIQKIIAQSELRQRAEDKMAPLADVDTIGMHNETAGKEV